MAIWPLTLEQKVNESGFNYAIGDTVSRTDMDIGPAKSRRRFTRGIDTMSLTINLDISEYADFRNFFDTTIAGGVTPFSFTNPITQAVDMWRFKESPSINSIGGGHFILNMSWERQP